MARRGLYGTFLCRTEIKIALCAFAAVAVFAAPPAGAAPAPCGGVAQISDPTGDGHHANTDVLSAWFSEQAGRLQAVIKVRQALWEPAHEDSDRVSVAFLFDVGGAIRYVRAEAFRPPAPIQYDHGTWTGGGGFLSAGPSAGEAVAGSGGTVTIDVPGQAAGTVLSRPFVLTWDGHSGTEPHWVDRAPGGVTPAGTEYGADYIVGACGAGGGGVSAQGVTAVNLTARDRLVGGGSVKVRGSVAPARSGVEVELSAQTRRSETLRLTTAADGTFDITLPVTETTRLRAVAGGIGSQTRTITVVSKVRIKVKRRRGGGVLIRGKVSPALPGRVLFLRTTAFKPTARTSARKGRFSFRFKNLRRGRYQAVFIPSKGRAERSNSNKRVIR